MRRWIAALDAEQIGNNQTLFQDPALWYWNGFHRCKAGYSKAFFEAHREEITLHKAAKDAFQKMGVSKLPKVKELSEEYATVLEQKKSLYAQYRLAREEMREYQKALHNTEVFFDMDCVHLPGGFHHALADRGAKRRLRAGHQARAEGAAG